MPVGLFDTFHNHQNLVLRLSVDFAAMSQGTPRQKVPRSPLRVDSFALGAGRSLCNLHAYRYHMQFGRVGRQIRFNACTYPKKLTGECG